MRNSLKWGAALSAAVLVAACGDLPTQGALSANDVLSEKKGQGAGPMSSHMDVIIYGADVGALDGTGNGDLYEVNLTTGEVRLIYAFAPSPSPDDPFSPNGLAFDGTTGRLYYSVTLGGPQAPSSAIHYVDVTNPVPTTFVTEIDGRIYNADISAGGYYFVANESRTLTRVDLATAAASAVCVDIGPQSSGWAFGDIAIREGVVYGSARQGNGTPGEAVYFFTIDTSDCSENFIFQGAGDMLQLAWGQDGALYGHNTRTGAFGTVDPGTGTFTSTGPVQYEGETLFFSDLAPGFTAPPPPGIQGCTPGFWRNHHHQWVNYTPGQLFNDVFGSTPIADNRTLGQAVQQGGGGWSALGRQAVAALLNAAHPDVNYPLTEQQVIDAVQAAAADPAIVESTKDMLEDYNELGCSLQGGPAR
jgi:hypothetical protein